MGVTRIVLSAAVIHSAWDYAGGPLTLDSPRAMAAVPGIQTALVRLAGNLAAAAPDD